MAERVTEDDLRLAAEWCDNYEEGADGADEMIRLRRVANWLRKMADDRQRESQVRAGMKQTGAPRKVVVRALATLEAKRRMEAERV
jgi:hypothetical protein